MEDKDYSENEPIIDDLDDDFEDDSQSPLIPIYDEEEQANAPQVPIDLEKTEDNCGQKAIIPIDLEALKNYNGKICPQCGTEYEEKFSFCTKDRSKLYSLWKCQHCGADFKEIQGYAQLSHCHKCGKEIPAVQQKTLNDRKSGKPAKLNRICSKCGRKYTGSERYCESCGSFLLSMQCSCGEIFRQGADGSFDKFCPKCGILNPIFDNALQEYLKIEQSKYEKSNLYRKKPLRPLTLEDFSNHKAMVCSKCGKIYDNDENVYCSDCGGKLLSIWKCLHCGADFTEIQGYTQINYCHNCGKAIQGLQNRGINSKKSGESAELKRICSNCGQEGTEQYCGYCGGEVMSMQCSCGEIFHQSSDGSFDIYCPVCGKPNPVEQEKQRKAAEEALKTKKEEQERIRKQHEEERKKAEARRIAEEKERQHREWINNLKVGDIIKFGSYPYEANGTEKPIEWIILEKYSDGTVLLLSKYGLDARRFDAKSNNWKRSEIRQWLNNEFYNGTFKDEEKNAILEYREAGSKVFLLSVEEAGKYFKNDNDRKACLTPYAKKRGAYTKGFFGGLCWWWLRSPGYSPGYFQDCAAGVYGGGVDYRGNYVDDDDLAVRVALKINLKNL